MSDLTGYIGQLKKEAEFEESEENRAGTHTSFLNASNEDHFSKSSPCRLLKTLLNGGCSYDCSYCRVCRNKNPAQIDPKSLADYFLTMNRNNVYDGIFLSSGIIGDVDLVMHDIIETGEIIRKGGFSGYMHLKILPGASRSDIKAAAATADRISINIETTSKSRMSEIAGAKDYMCDILKRLDWIASEAPGRHTTQIVVGCADENDKEIIGCIKDLYRTVRPKRVYYSAFKAQKNTPLEEHENTKKWRTNRLYQTDYLIRDYGYRPEEFYPVLDESGFLENTDPKILLAKKMKRIDISNASREELLRIPGIGIKRAEKICSIRKNEGFDEASGKKYSGIITKKAIPHIILENNGYQSLISDYQK